LEIAKKIDKYTQFGKKTAISGHNKNYSKIIKKFVNPTQNGLTELL